MKILSINSGSSSLKFSLFDMKDESIIASGLFERIGIEGSNYCIKYNGEKISQELELNNHTDAVSRHSKSSTHLHRPHLPTQGLSGHYL